MKTIKTVFFLLASWFLLHCLVISYDGLNDDIPAKADCALLLGNKVEETGKLSLRLQSRCERGLELYQKGIVPKIIVSGGLGKEGFWEGDKMRDFLVENKVPDSCIIVDNWGNNTFLTAKNYMTIAKNKNFKSVIIVSQFSHLTRTRYIMRKEGAKNTFCAHSYYYSITDLYHLIREFFAYYAYIFKT